MLTIDLKKIIYSLGIILFLNIPIINIFYYSLLLPAYLIFPDEYSVYIRLIYNILSLILLYYLFSTITKDKKDLKKEENTESLKKSLNKIIYPILLYSFMLISPIFLYQESIAVLLMFIMFIFSTTSVFIIIVLNYLHRKNNKSIFKKLSKTVLIFWVLSYLFTLFIIL